MTFTSTRVESIRFQADMKNGNPNQVITGFRFPIEAEAHHHDDSDRLLESSDGDHDDGTLQQTSAKMSDICAYRAFLMRPHVVASLVLGSTG